MRDTLLDDGVRSALARQGQSEEIDRAMSSVQDIAGSLEDGLGSDLTRFWSSWADVAANPQGITARSSVIDAGTRLASTLQAAHTRIDGLASSSKGRMSGYADQVTALATTIAKLNGSILDVTTAGGTPNDFIDQRNVAVEQLSKLTGAQVRNNGPMIDVIVGGGLLVAGVRAQTMTVAGDPPSVKLDGSAVTAGGSMGALQNLATKGLDDLRLRLDLIANGLRDAMNTAHAAGKDLDGQSGIAFFTGSGAADFSVNSSLTARQIAASASGQAADGNNALALADVRYAATVGTLADPTNISLTAGDAVADLVSDLGRRAAGAQRELDATTSMVSALDGRRAETSGVSIDEEMTALLSYQRAYEAAARIIAVSDTMLDTLINRLGR